MSTPTEDTTPEEKKPTAPTFVLSDTAANWIIGVVTAMWALNILAGMVKFNDYQPSEIIHGVFMTIVGGAFMLRIRGGLMNPDPWNYLCNAFTASVIGLVVGIVIGMLLCHYGIIRLRKGTHR